MEEEERIDEVFYADALVNLGPGPAYRADVGVMRVLAETQISYSSSVPDWREHEVNRRCRCYPHLGCGIDDDFYLGETVPDNILQASLALTLVGPDCINAEWAVAVCNDLRSVTEYLQAQDSAELRSFEDWVPVEFVFLAAYLCMGDVSKAPLFVKYAMPCDVMNLAILIYTHRDSAVGVMDRRIVGIAMKFIDIYEDFAAEFMTQRADTCYGLYSKLDHYRSPNVMSTIYLEGNDCSWDKHRNIVADPDGTPDVKELNQFLFRDTFTTRRSPRLRVNPAFWYRANNMSFVCAEAPLGFAKLFDVRFAGGKTTVYLDVKEGARIGSMPYELPAHLPEMSVRRDYISVLMSSCEQLALTMGQRFVVHTPRFSWPWVERRSSVNSCGLPDTFGYHYPGPYILFGSDSGDRMGRTRMCFIPCSKDDLGAIIRNGVFLRPVLECDGAQWCGVDKYCYKNCRCRSKEFPDRLPEGRFGAMSYVCMAYAVTKAHVPHVFPVVSVKAAHRFTATVIPVDDVAKAVDYKCRVEAAICDGSLTRASEMQALIPEFMSWYKKFEGLKYDLADIVDMVLELWPLGDKKEVLTRLVSIFGYRVLAYVLLFDVQSVGDDTLLCARNDYPKGGPFVLVAPTVGRIFGAAYDLIAILIWIAGSFKLDIGPYAIRAKVRPSFKVYNPYLYQRGLAAYDHVGVAVMGGVPKYDDSRVNATPWGCKEMHRWNAWPTWRIPDKLLTARVDGPIYTFQDGCVACNDKYFVARQVVNELAVVPTPMEREFDMEFEVDLTEYD